MENRTFFYEGKAKTIYQSGKEDEVVIYYKDDATALNGKMKSTINNKGIYNNEITVAIFEYLQEKGIPTHYIKQLSNREQLCKKVTILPLEVILRNVVVGSMAKRLGLEEGLILVEPVMELCYKEDALDDPLINDDHAIVLKAATREDLAIIYKLTKAINEALIELFNSLGITLVDFKIEFGKDCNGNILLADEISPDTCRLWYKETGEKLDKDRFRRNLGGVEGAYQEMTRRINEKRGSYSMYIGRQLNEDCGIFGVYGHEDSGAITYYGLHSLQHRGQEGCGILSYNGETFHLSKGEGLVIDTFTPEKINLLKGFASIGHVRYSTAGGGGFENVQPLYFRSLKETIGIAHNGNIINSNLLKQDLENSGSIFQSTSDTEVMAHLLKKYQGSMVERLEWALKQLDGAFAFLLLTEEGLFAGRDRYGFRPLSIGRLSNGGIVLSSETCGLETAGATFVRDVAPGEVIFINETGIHSSFYSEKRERNMCMMEYIYFSRPDSTIEGVNVYEARKRMGQHLFCENPIDADVVVGVPDSSIPAASGYSETSRIPYGMGLVKNRYVGRTFIQPTQALRKQGVRMKLSAVSQIIKGKRIVLIDDSIVRGTTSKRIVGVLKKAGAKEVHVRIAAPPIKVPCFYGVDTSTFEELVSMRMNEDTLCKFISADSLKFLSEKGLVEAG